MNAPNQTFPQVLHNSPTCGRIKTNNGWLICPKCGRGKVLKLLPTTAVKDLEVYCKTCKQRSVVNIPEEPAP